MKTVNQIKQSEMSMKNANNKKTIDGYLIADVMTVIAIILFICSISTQEKKIFLLFSIAATASLAGICLQMFNGTAQIRNNSTNTVFAKDESSAQLVKIRPNEVHSGLDGVVSTDKVYKLPDGVHAKIGADGQVKVISVIGRFIYKVCGGELNVSPDAVWNNLFDVKL